MLILASLMLIVGGATGFRAFLSLLFNFAMLFLNIALIAWGFPALVITVITSLIILATTIFMGSDDDQVTQNAFYSSVLVLIVLIGLICVMQPHLMVQGFGNENNEDLEGMSLLVGVKFSDVMTSTMIVSTLGAIAEAAIAVSAGLEELIETTPDLAMRRLFIHGYDIGKEIIGTALNTLFFGFFGSFLGLFIWYIKLKYQFSEFFNNKIFAAELSMILIGFIGVISTVPLTAWVMQWRKLKHR
jgi:uncharacterized membrane protein